MEQKEDEAWYCFGSNNCDEEILLRKSQEWIKNRILDCPTFDYRFIFSDKAEVTSQVANKEPISIAIKAYSLCFLIGFIFFLLS